MRIRNCLLLGHHVTSRLSTNGFSRHQQFHESASQCLKQSRCYWDATLDRNQRWVQPSGSDTGITLLNTATRSKVPLILPITGNLNWYVCGPTVYDDPHIGHACCYVRFDIIRRILTNVFNINVVYMMNITDIDDKIIVKAKQIGQTPQQLAGHYEDRFLQSLVRLDVLKPTITRRVTENVGSIIAFVQGLVDNGSAYATDEGNVYFRCSSYPQYGSLSKMNSPADRATTQADKLDPEDFALWKSAKAGEPWWESPWGNGRPAWHIECSALASDVFGANIDIHSGGDDLLFPHHENELAQSNCYHKTTQWVNYWLHAGLLRIKDDTEKMSKSLGNVISIDQLLHKYTSSQFRIFCLLFNYHAALEFSDDGMRKAMRIHKKLSSLRHLADLYIQSGSEEGGGDIDELLLWKSLTVTQDVVRQSLADSFDTPRAMAAIMNLVHVCNIELCKRSTSGVVRSKCVGAVAAAVNYIETMMSNLGVNISSQPSSASTADNPQQLAHVLNSVTAFRQKVRHFSLGGSMAGTTAEKAEVKAHRKSHAALLDCCDQLRDELSTLAGVDIQDTKGGQSSWQIIDRAEADQGDSAVDRAEPDQGDSIKT